MRRSSCAASSLAAAATLGLLVWLSASFLAPSPAFALGRPATGSNCSASWVNNAGAMSCFIQGEDEAQRGVAHPHYVACLNGDIFCCVDNDAGAQNCEAQASTAKSSVAQMVRALLGAHKTLLMSLGRYTGRPGPPHSEIPGANRARAH